MTAKRDDDLARQLPPFLRGRAVLVVLAIAVSAMLAVGFLPLFDGPGYEIALAAGLILPVLAAIATAVDLSPRVFAARHEGRGSPQPLDMVLRGIANGAVVGLAGYLTTLIHGARAGFCDVWSGTRLFVLGPLCGAILGGVWGALSAEIAGRAKTARRRSIATIFVSFAGPLATVLVSLWRFYASPMVFAYDPFVGYFSGTIYDTIIDASGLVTYRVGTLATLLAVLSFSALITRSDDGRLKLLGVHEPSPRDVLRAIRERARARWVLFAGALCALLSAVHIAVGPELGHYQTPATIAEALGARTEGARCTVLHPRGIRPDDMARFVRDCDAHVRALEAWFEAKGPDRITVYLFADVGQKAALMGAARTQIAKPWRREIYIQNAPYPHPVVGHELAHVVAGAFAGGPFHVAGDLFGFLPNPGLIEGVAEAASPREGDLTSAEWARAMKDLGILPKLDQLFALSFFGSNSSVAYTVSGAFVEYIKSAHGAAAVRAFYKDNDLPAITGESWAEMETKFHRELDALTLTEAATAQAKARFDRPSIFGRRCPHVVDECHRRAEGLKNAGDEDGVLEQFAIVRALDPNDPMVPIHVARSKIRRGEIAQGKAELRAVIEDDKAPRHVRDRALEDLADLELAPGGDGAFAQQAYKELMQRTVDEGALRTLEVKATVIDSPRARAALFYYLVGDPGRGADRVRASELFGVWSVEAPDDGTPDYLMARQLIGSGLFEEAAARLDRARSKKLALARVEKEALRLRIISACALSDSVLATKFNDAYRGRQDVPRSRREAMDALVQRATAPAATAP